MLNLLAQAEKTFWNAPSGSGELKLKVALCFLIGFALMVGVLFVPARGRKFIVAAVTFVAGLFYMMFWLWPQPFKGMKGDQTVPRDFVESVGFYVKDAQGVVADFTNILTAFLLGLGAYSIVRIHGQRIVKQSKDWSYSLVLLVSMVIMSVVGYVNFVQTKIGDTTGKLQEKANWTNVQKLNDVLFDGVLQQMESAMFSIIAFYILSAAYRAFRIRSVEATILLGSAFIMMFSLLGLVQSTVDGLIAGNGTGFITNFTLKEIAFWIQQNIQTPALRGIDFGVGISLLAMGLRLWLSLDKGGQNA